MAASAELHTGPQQSVRKGAVDLSAELHIGWAMSDLLDPIDIERLAQRMGIPMAEVCRRAGVAPSIFSRWKAGKTEPNLDNYRRIRDAAMGKLPVISTGKQSESSPARSARSKPASTVSKPKSMGSASATASPSVDDLLPRGKAA